MEMLPPVGWADVATKQDLAAVRGDIDALRGDLTREIDAFRSEVDLRFETFEHKIMGALHKEMTAQTWRLVTAATAMFGLFAAVVRL